MRAQYYLGIDVGSVTTDMVLLDEQQRIVYSDITATVADGRAAAQCLFEKMLAVQGLTSEAIAGSVACGYGRENVPFTHKTMTEITCHATAAHALFPNARTVIDIGGEDTKVIALDESGKMRDFIMNNKCAAGTGRFLEAIAERLHCSLKECISAGEQSYQALEINSTCTVFAESEVVNLIARGASLGDIAAAVHRTIAGRIIDFSGRLRDRGGAIVLTGGVAKNGLFVRFMREGLDGEVLIPDDPQLAGAYGAALLAKKD